MLPFDDDKKPQRCVHSSSELPHVLLKQHTHSAASADTLAGAQPCNAEVHPRCIRAIVHCTLGLQHKHHAPPQQ
jgi:hypothetical protein